MAEAELGGAEGGVGKSGGFTSSHRTACGVGRREGLLGMGTSLPPCAGLPVSSGHINRGLQFSVFCFPTCNACGSVLYQHFFLSIVCLYQGLTGFSVKGQMVNILGLGGHMIFVAMIQR